MVVSLDAPRIFCWAAIHWSILRSSRSRGMTPSNVTEISEEAVPGVVTSWREEFTWTTKPGRSLIFANEVNHSKSQSFAGTRKFNPWFSDAWAKPNSMRCLVTSNEHLWPETVMSRHSLCQPVTVGKLWEGSSSPVSDQNRHVPVSLPPTK